VFDVAPMGCREALELARREEEQADERRH
jgi:hypothetical protein